MTAGQTYAPQWRNYRDPHTGRRVCQLTDSPAEDYHLYLYNSNRTDTSNIYLRDWDGAL